MSSYGQQAPGLEDDDPWGQASRASTHGAEDSSAQGAFADDVTDVVVDAPSTEVPAKKKSIVPKLVFGAMVLVVLGVAGSGVYNLYRKIVPAPEVASTDDRHEATAAAVTAAAPASSVSIPGMTQAGGEASTIGASASSLPAVDPAAVAAPVAAVPASAASPVAATASPPAHPVAMAPAAPAVAPVATPATAPAKVEVAAAKPSPGPKAQEAAPPAQATKSEKNQQRQAQAARKLQRAERAAAASAASRTERPVRKLAVGARTRAGKSAVAAKAAARPAEPTEQIGSGTLSSYRIESIEPRFGEHQNAWIRSRDGRLQVVSSGDSFDGVRVIKVDGASYQVQTTQGVIR